ncbi:MAG: hypothetical protein P4L99_21170 [Chthoniobacter sp.]|nr:hypothetical protein [Chthoniobacter sp.]
MHSCFNGDGSAQQAKAIKLTALYARCAVKFKLPVKDAVYMFNTFLITKMELSFHYNVIHGLGTSSSRWLQQCDCRLGRPRSCHHAGSAPLPSIPTDDVGLP